MNYNFRNLVFEGGGVKGIAYLGALEVLTERNIIQQAERIGGTSAGAINAVILGLGFTIEEISSGKVWFEKVYPDPASKQEAISKWIEDVKRNQPVGIIEHYFYVTCKDGTVKNVLFRPFFSKTGDIYIFYDDHEFLLS